MFCVAVTLDNKSTTGLLMIVETPTLPTGSRTRNRVPVIMLYLFVAASPIFIFSNKPISSTAMSWRHEVVDAVEVESRNSEQPLLLRGFFSPGQVRLYLGHGYKRSFQHHRSSGVNSLSPFVFTSNYWPRFQYPRTSLAKPLRKACR